MMAINPDKKATNYLFSGQHVWGFTHRGHYFLQAGIWLLACDQNNAPLGTIPEEKPNVIGGHVRFLGRNYMPQPPGITCHHSSLTFRVCWTWWQPLFAMTRCCLSILGLSSYIGVPSHQMKTPSTPSSYMELSWLCTWPQFLPPSPSLFHNICLDSNHLIHSLLTVQSSFACTAALALAHCSQNNYKQLLEKSCRVPELRASVR